MRNISLDSAEDCTKKILPGCLSVAHVRKFLKTTFSQSDCDALLQVIITFLNLSTAGLQLITVYYTHYSLLNRY